MRGKIMDNVVKLPTKRTYMVEVTHGDGMFTAECDALHLVTEASTFEALTARVWELVPDMIEANGLDVDVDSMRIHFNFEQSAQDIRLVI